MTRRRAEGAQRAGTEAPYPRGLHERPVAHPQLLDHRPHRPRQVDAGRSHPGDDPHRRPARRCATSCWTRWTSSASAASRSRPRRSASTTPPRTARPTSCTSSTRPATSTSPTRSRRSLAGVRGRAARRRRLPGRRGPDAREHLPGGRGGPGDHPLPQQDRPARAPSPSAWPARSPSCSARTRTSIRRISGKTGEGVEEVLEELVAARPAAGGDPDARAARADLRLRVRPVPRRGRLHPRRRRRSSGRATRSARWPAGTEADIDEIGFFTPAMTPIDRARAGRGGLRHHRV